jgi:hypothetical protein
VPPVAPPVPSTQQGQPGQGGPAYQPGGYQPSGAEAPREKPAAPEQGWGGYGEQVEVEPRSGRGRKIAIIAAIVVLVVGVGGFVGWSLSTRQDSYSVGTCVKQEGNTAVVVGCGSPGAFRITSIVDSESGCPDPAQPSLELNAGGSKRYACMAPAVQ